MLRHRLDGHSQHRKSSPRLLTAVLVLNLATLTGLAFGDGWTAKTTTSRFVAQQSVGHRDLKSPRSSNSTWSPRPLALPAISDSVPAWEPPERKVGGPSAEPLATTIVIQPPTPPVEEPAPPTPAEIRQKRILQERADAKRKAERAAATQIDRPLPPSDEINRGSRRSQLAAAAVEQLRIAHWAAQRGASESARQAATQTLRTIAALRDTEIGDNAFTGELNAALLAIRESTDFSGRYGPVDTAAIDRLIEVHQTSVLKGVATEHLTSARAVEAYLNFAQARLVNATQGGPLAAQATMILADLESLAANSSGTIDSPPEHSALHSSELALMYRRAAVEIAPDNAEASADLGRMLLKRSIPEPAKELLLRSVRVAPTRQRMESLLQAAAKSGDFVLVDQCEKRLASRRLPSELPVTRMSPHEFARTGQTLPPGAVPAEASYLGIANGTGTGNGMGARNVAGLGPSDRVAARPLNPNRRNSRARSHAPVSNGGIVDPTLPQSWFPQPANSSAPPSAARRLFW